MMCTFTFQGLEASVDKIVVRNLYMKKHVHKTIVDCRSFFHKVCSIGLLLGLGQRVFQITQNQLRIDAFRNMCLEARMVQAKQRQLIFCG